MNSVKCYIHYIGLEIDQVDIKLGNNEFSVEIRERFKTQSKDKQLRNDTACKAAEEFTKLYFESFDSKRHLISKFYMDDATFVWDGNPAVGRESIGKFFDELPETVHVLTALDAQPVYFEAVKGQETVLVQVAGFIKFSKEKEMKGFSQSFLLTAQDKKWKIVNDSCRLQVPLNSRIKT